MKYHIHSHRDAEINVPSNLRDQVVEAIKVCDVKIKQGNATAVRKELLAKLREKGWPSKVAIDSVSKISITSMRNNIGLCLQTGNMGRMYADLLKLQTIFAKSKIKAGILILASKKAAKEMGKNIANSERIVNELKIFDSTITIPLLVIGVE